MRKALSAQSLRRGGLLAGVLIFILLLIPAAQAQTAPVDESQTYILDSSMLITSDYNTPFTGVYLVAPGNNTTGTALPPQLDYYLRPDRDPIQLLSNGAIAATPGGQPLGDSAWQSEERKIEILIHPDEIFGRAGYTLRDVQNLSWYTHKPDAFNNPDWYVNIWLDASGDTTADTSSRDVAFLSGEPYWSTQNSGTYAANTWIQWTADQTAGGPFEINFTEPGYACTNFGPGTSVLPSLDELATGDYTWQGVPGNPFLPGCGVVPDPVNTTINYADMPILGISIATGSSWANGFEGYVDDLVIELDNNGATDTLVFDFEAEPLLNAPQITKAFAPNPITPGSTSTLSFTLSNPNNTPLSGLAFTDNFPAGLTVANPSGAVNNCGGTFTAAAGGTSVDLTGGYLDGMTSCTIAVDTTATAVGDYTNTTTELTTTTQRQGFEVGDTASDILTVATVDPIYDSVPAPGSTLDLSGTAATNPQSATIDVSNIGDAGSLLDVTQVSISAGYTVTGLPITGLTPADAAVTLTVSCDVPQEPGTLLVQTNEIEAPQYTYDLLCNDTTIEATPEPTEPPPSEGGDPGDTGGDTGEVTELPESVEQLPTTGESPMWRDTLLALVAGLLALGTAGTLYLRRQ